jgi:CheY-like chemotaxis protein/anti-sigma regulatory factor (Ser/Thr protein kinase)
MAGEAGTALKVLVDDVLDLSRVEAGKARVASADYDVRGVARSVVRVLEPELAGRPLTIAARIAPEVPLVVRGDEQRVRQILLNLAGNAVKYTERGRIELLVQARDGELRLSVSDTGRGIAADDLARVFEPYKRAGRHALPGTGLGLTISLRLARAMGGDLTAESGVGAGSVFTLRLPLVAGAERVVAAGAVGPAGADRPVSPPLPPMRVLAAEDDPILRSVLGFQLERLGVRARLVADGAEAAEAVEGGAFDAALLDLRMPGVDGLEAARRIRLAERAAGRPRLPIAALSGDATPEDRAASRAAGMDVHLAKPVDLDELRGTLRDFAGRARDVAAFAPAVVDGSTLGELAEAVGGGLVAELLDRYRAELPGRVSRVRAAAEVLDAAALRAACHDLRGASATLGFAGLAGAAGALETRARAGALDDVVARLDDVVRAADAAAGALAGG